MADLGDLGGSDLVRTGILVENVGLDQATQELLALATTGDQIGSRIGGSASRGVSEFSQAFANGARAARESLSNATRLDEALVRANAIQAAREFESTIQRQFETDQARIREGAARGFLTTAEARTAGIEAARAYNDAVVGQLDTLGGTGASAGSTQIYRDLANSLKTIPAPLSEVTKTATAAGASMNALRSSAVSMAASAVGAAPGVTQLSSVLGTMVAGAPIVAGVLAGIAAIAYGYRAFTADAREAAKAADDFAKTQQGRAAASTGLGILASARVSAGSNSLAGGVDIPALSNDSQKAADAVSGLLDKLKALDVGGGAGSTIAGGPTRDVRELIHQFELGQGSATDFLVRIQAIGEAHPFDTVVKDAVNFGLQLIAAKEHADQLQNTLQQATAQQNYFTLGVNASSVSEGKLFEQTKQRLAVLAAIRSGGSVAGDRATDQNEALSIAQKLYEDAATSGKHAELATVAFQDALKNTASVAHGFAVDYLADAQTFVGTNRAISDSLKQQTTATSDATRLSALADQIQRFAQESQALGKDQSIDTRVAAMSSELDKYVDAVARQVVAGTKSQKDFDDAGAAAEGLRQALFEAGQQFKDTANAQVSKGITDQYNASKQLFEAVVDGTGAYHELTAAKQAQLEIDRLALQLGHELSDEDQQRIRDAKSYDAAVESSKGTKDILEHTAAVRAEIAAIQSGASSRATYASDLKYQSELAAAALITNKDVHDARVKAVEDNHNAAAALDELKAHTQALSEAEKQATKDLQGIGSALERDLLRGVEQFATRGITSFRSFFSEAAQLSTQMVGQLDASIQKLSNDWVNVFANDGDTSALDAELEKLEKIRSIAGGIGAAVTGGFAGYNIGSQTGNTEAGLFGGAAVGAASGAAFGPWGAAIGGLTGAAGGLLGAAEAHRKAAQEIRDSAKAFSLSVQQYASTSSVGSALANENIDYNQRRLAGLDTLNKTAGSKDQGPQYEAYNALQQLDRAHIEKLNRIVSDFFDSVTQRINASGGAAGAYANALEQIKKQHDDDLANLQALVDAGKVSGINASFTRQQIEDLTKALEAAAKAQYDLGQLQINSSLAARDATSKGFTYSAQQLQRQQDEAQQLYDAQYQQGYSSEQLDRLKEIQKNEDAAALAQLISDAQSAAAKLTAVSQAQRDTLDLQALQAKHATELADLQNANADAQLIAATKAKDAAEEASLAWQQAVAAIQQASSDLQQQFQVFGTNPQDQLASVTKLYGFDGLSLDQVLAKYTAVDLNNPGNITDAQRELNKEIADFAKYYTAANSGTASATSNATSAAKEAINPNDAVISAVKGISDPVANRLADITYASYQQERTQTDYIRDIRDAVTGGGIPSFASPPNFASATAPGVGPIGDIASAIAARNAPASQGAPTIVKSGDTYNITVAIDPRRDSESDEAYIARVAEKVSERLYQEAAQQNLARGNPTLLGQ